VSCGGGNNCGNVKCCATMCLDDATMSQCM
jgi:hypothetical protein